MLSETSKEIVGSIGEKLFDSGIKLHNLIEVYDKEKSGRVDVQSVISAIGDLFNKVRKSPNEDP